MIVGDDETTAGLREALGPVMDDEVDAALTAACDEDVSVVAYRLAEVLGEWSSMYLDVEKVAGHLVLVHGWSPPDGPRPTHDALIAEHRRAHEAMPYG